MKQTIETQPEALIDLGAVTEQTKGAIGGKNDSVGLLPQTGMSED